MLAGSDSDETTTYISNPNVSVSLYCPSNVHSDGSMYFYSAHRNSGTEDLTDYVLTVDLPTLFQAEQLCYFSREDVVYSLYLVTEQGEEIALLEDATEWSGVLTLSDYTSETVVQILVKYASYTCSTTLEPLKIKGYVGDFLGDTMEFTATATALYKTVTVSATASKDTDIDTQSELTVSKNIEDAQSSYYALDEFWVKLSTACYTAQSVDPIYADLLPKELLYLSDRLYYLYRDSFSMTYYDSRVDEMPFPAPVVELIEDFDGDSDLLRISFTGLTLGIYDYLYVYYPVMVGVGASSFESTAYMGNPTGQNLVESPKKWDSLDLDGDGDTTEYLAISDTISGVVLSTSDFSIQKKVMGDLDSEYGDSGTVSPNGTLSYQLRVLNNQDAVLRQIDMVDILPFVGDTGVITTDTPRDSAFSVLLTGPATGEVVHKVTGVVRPVTITSKYSTSTNPIRFGSDGSEIGSGTWDSDTPSDWGSIASVEVYLGEDLQAYEELQVTLPCEVSGTAVNGETAYNSFAMKADVSGDTEVTTVLPTEPTKVAVTVEGDAPEPETGSISGYVWYDSNEDGIFDTEEVGYDGLTVELYEDTGVLVASTLSAVDTSGGSGYYLFSDLDAGAYQVKFVTVGDLVLSPQNAQLDNGSKPDALTGFTAVFALAEGETLTDVDAGVYVQEDTSGLEQAINDLITSIALEECGIRGILDAEGAKIQKAVALELTTEEMLAVNDSVSNMVEAITDLELVLLAKLQIVAPSDTDSATTV